MALERPYDDVPGTVIFDSVMARKGYHLNQFCMSLMKPENREKFLAGEEKYLENWKLSLAQKKAVLSRDYNGMIAAGGNIYYLAKIFSTDGKSFVHAASKMTGMNEDDYKNMMLSGGRSPDGNRSKSGGK